MKLKCLTIIILLLLSAAFVSAQAIVPNGDFEQWENRELFKNFPPFETITNTIAIIEGAEANVTQVPGCDGGHAVRLETIDIGEDTIAGFLTIGSLTSLTPGEPFTGEPDSVHFCLRYDIQPGDTAMIFFVFFSEGQIAAQIQPNRFSGSQPSWTSVDIDLPPFAMPVDSFAIAMTSSWFDDTPVLPGSWMEIDSIYMKGDSTGQIPNHNFETFEALTYDDPVNWYSTNAFTRILAGSQFVSQSTESFSGSYAARIETQAFNFGGDGDTIAFLANGQDIGDDGPIGGQPYTGSSIPTNLSGFYKYIPIEDDTAAAFLGFGKYDPTGDSLRIIGEFGVSFPPSETYIYFNIPISLTEMPDTFQLGFASSDFGNDFSQAEVNVGSVLWVDSIHFDGVNSISELQIPADFVIAPNPASDLVRITFEAIAGGEYELQFSNATGQVLKNEKIESALSGDRIDHPFYLHPYPNGLYFISLKNEFGDILISEKLILSR